MYAKCSSAGKRLFFCFRIFFLPHCISASRVRPAHYWLPLFLPPTSNVFRTAVMSSANKSRSLDDAVCRALLHRIVMGMFISVPT